MIFDRFFRKKVSLPTGNNTSPAAMEDVTERIPETDDILASIDKALETADRMEGSLGQQSPPRRTCGC